jgi:hypothetical protein
VLERVGLPPAPVEREHRELVRALAQGVLRREGERFSRDLRVAAEGDPCVQVLLERDEPQLLEPLGLPARELLVAKVPERTTAPEGQRPLGERGCERRVVASSSRLAVAQQPLEARRVELLGCELEDVCAVPGDAGGDPLQTDSRSSSTVRVRPCPTTSAASSSLCFAASGSAPSSPRTSSTGPSTRISAAAISRILSGRLPLGKTWLKRC